MQRQTTSLAVLFAFSLSLMTLPAGAASARRLRPERHPSLRQVIDRVTAMPGDGALRQRLQRLGLNVVNVMWEDTGRSAGSAFGPNISDLTLQVVESDGRRSLLPVIRYPNFTDRTADVPIDKLLLRVGNHEGHTGDELEVASLREVLSDLRRFLSDPSSLKSDGNFIARDDTHVLVSAQHVFLPVAAGGKVEFQPVIFNYQSAPGNPAVLTLLVTRQGMSATIVENRGGNRSRGEELFHNDDGQRTRFTGERRSDVAARIEAEGETGQDVGALDPGADVILLVQVPLKHRHRGLLPGLPSPSPVFGAGSAMEMAPKASARRALAAAPDIEAAVVGHGEHLGPFAEMRNLKLERDERFPIRVTVQFYRATSNGVFGDDDIQSVHREIERVYAEGDYVGSLVVPEGSVRHRPTDWIRKNPGGDTWQHPWWLFRCRKPGCRTPGASE